MKPLADEGVIEPSKPDACGFAQALQELSVILEENAKGGSNPQHGEFFHYWGLANFRRAYHKQEKDWTGFEPLQVDFCERMFILASDFGMLMTIIDKINWLNCQHLKGSLSKENWGVYIQADIHAFHAELRSIFDSIAKAAVVIGGDKAQAIKDKSFEKLRNFCRDRREQAENILGAEIVSLITDLDWFAESRSMRDSILHYEKDAELGSSPDLKTLFFRTKKGSDLRPIYQGPSVFQGGEGWISLSPYLGYYLGRLWYFLDAFCRLAGKKLCLGKGSFFWVAPRLDATLACIRDAKIMLESGSKT